MKSLLALLALFALLAGCTPTTTSSVHARDARPAVDRRLVASQPMYPSADRDGNHLRIERPSRAALRPRENRPWVRPLVRR